MIKVIQDSVVNMDVECIVNAANTSLSGGGGVDGAIHKAAGDKLYEACSKIGYCGVGEAVITPGFNLKAKYIIHTVGPIYMRLNKAENERLLGNCYKNSLDLARNNNIHSIAFPCISTGVYGYPIEEATTVAINTVNKWLETNNYEIDIYFNCYKQEEYDTYMKLI